MKPTRFLIRFIRLVTVLCVAICLLPAAPVFAQDAAPSDPVPTDPAPVEPPAPTGANPADTASSDPHSAATSQQPKPAHSGGGDEEDTDTGEEDVQAAAVESADVLAAGDPYYYDSAHHRYEYADIAAALSHFNADKGVGILYAAGGFSEPVHDINIDALDLVSPVPTLTGLVYDKTGVAKPVINGSVTIQNMINGFRFEGFTVTGLLYAHDNGGLLKLVDLTLTNNIAGTKVKVENQNGDIELNDVEAGFSTDSGGADLDNDPTLRRNIRVINSTFQYNKRTGLSIYTDNGNITLTQVNASFNLQGGSDISNYNTGTVIVNGGVFSSNASETGNYPGLKVYSAGAVTLNSVTASYNDDSGVAVYAESTAPISILNPTGRSIFSDNTNKGLGLIANGNKVTLRGIWVSYNGQNIDLTGSGTTVSVTDVQSVRGRFGSITLHATGVITLNRVTVTSNQSGNILWMDNSGGAIGTPGISLQNVSLSLNKGVSEIYSKGTIAFTNLSINADDPTVIGLIVDNTAGTSAGVTINGATLMDITKNALYINTNGTVSLSAVTTERSGGDGVRITAGGNVNISKSKFNANANYGLAVDTYGNILLNGVSAARNTTHGATINNSLALPANNKTVTVNNSVFSQNGAAGLVVNSNNLITINKVSALSNGISGSSYGVYLDNSSGGGTAGIKLLSTLGPNRFEGNNNVGAYLVSNGPVTSGKLSVLRNTGKGFQVAASSSINISDALVSNNAGNGLDLYSNGAITLTRLNVLDNRANGALVSNNAATSAPVNISYSTFSNNFNDGLDITTGWAVNLSNLHADGNGTTGVSINNSGTHAAPLNISTSSFDGNGFFGLSASSGGAITISGISASNTLNTGFQGASINNSSATTPADVRVSNSVFTNNAGMGLMVSSLGNIVINQVTASNNLGMGASFNNNTSTAGTIAVTSSKFDMNKSGGLDVRAQGDITFNLVSANGSLNNWGAAVYSDVGNVSILRSSFNANDSGLYVNTPGNITLNKVSANNNTIGAGAQLDNSSGTGAVNILNSLGANQFSQNAQQGLTVQSTGVITLRGATVNQNGATGLLNGASLSTTNGDIYIYNSTFNDNAQYGFSAFITNPLNVLHLICVNMANNGTQTLIVSQYQYAGLKEIRCP